MKIEELRFDTLKICPGRDIDAHPDPKSKNTTTCTLVGLIPGQALVITAAAGQTPPPISEGQKIVIKLRTENGLAFFPTTVLLITDDPFFMAYADLPETVKYKRLRAAARVNVSLPVIAANQGKQLGSMTGQMVDVSATGAQIEATTDLGDRGDTIELKAKFSVANIQKILAIKATIRSKKRKPETLDDCIYGIQFFEDDDNNMLVLYGFVFSKIVDSNPKEIE